jgi:hypothetical protein
MNAKSLHHRMEDLGTGLTAIARTGTREAGEGVFTTAQHREAAHIGSVSEGKHNELGGLRLQAERLREARAAIKEMAQLLDVDAKWRLRMGRQPYWRTCEPSVRRNRAYGCPMKEGA